MNVIDRYHTLRTAGNDSSLTAERHPGGSHRKPDTPESRKARHAVTMSLCRVDEWKGMSKPKPSALVAFLSFLHVIVVTVISYAQLLRRLEPVFNYDA